MKHILLLAFFLIYSKFFGQDIKEQLKSINTIEEANVFVNTNKDITSQIVKIVPEIEENNVFTKRVKGEIFAYENSICKIIESKKTIAFRVSYIYLDGNKLSIESINKLRITILEKYKKGASFVDLVKQYTMDNSPNGDLGWFTEGMMVNEFETAIKSHKLNDIFTIDVPNEKWHYITLKTFIDKEVQELTVLQVKS
jgi:parvulin-like peptidyl-prolyl isomerase